MKKTLIIFLSIIVISLINYFILDRQLYYYGKSNFNFYQSLPLKIKPQYWGYDMGNLGFVLLDENEMTLISSGSKYWASNIEVKKIIKYGYTDEKLLAIVVDSTYRKYFIKCIKNIDVQSKQDITINVLDDKTPINYEEYKWVEINESYFRKIELIRNYLVITFIISFLISIYLVIRLRGKNI